MSSDANIAMWHHVSPMLPKCIAMLPQCDIMLPWLEICSGQNNCACISKASLAILATHSSMPGNLYKKNQIGLYILQSTAILVTALLYICSTPFCSTPCPLGRFIKSKFWNFDNSTHFLCAKYQYKKCHKRSFAQI